MNGRAGGASHRKNDADPRRRRPRWVAPAAITIVLATLVGLALYGLVLLFHPKPTGPTAQGPASAPSSSASAHPSGARGVSGIVHVCGNDAILGGGPSHAPRGAVTVPAGDNSGIGWGQANTTYWFAPGTHTLGPGQYTQIIPGPGSKFIGAPGAVISGEHDNFYAFGGSAPRVRISYLTIKDFGPKGGNQNQGVVNKDSAPGWKIDHSTLEDNAGAGAMLGSHNTLSYDCLKNNQQYGFNAYSPAGPVHLVIDHNEIAGNDTYNWEARQQGCGCTGGGKFWDVDGAVITDNWVHGNHSVGLWADTNNRSFEIRGNYFQDNYNSGLVYEISYNANIEDNTFVRNALGAGPTNPGFPTGAIYLSESGSDSRVPGNYGATLSVSHNTFINNWSGVILWENSNRFCGSPANTSTGVCTLVDPGVVKLQSCNRHNIASPPYYGTCRWKTQNVSVERNVFDFNPASIGPSCTIQKGCGFQGIFSEYGSFPSWSPYKGTIVEKHITFDQNNHFSDNTYHGPWRFMVLQQGNVVSWGAWQRSPYHQDAGSTISGHDA
jgi:parallel beta helix pectate lyase-like protein